jgi:undecaprenyl-diphosphatase
MATSLSLATKKWYVAVPAYLWASGVAYSRMYLGVHYPSDLLGGIVIGIGTSFLTWKIDQLILSKNK